MLIATDTTVQGGVDRYVVDLALAGRAAGAAVTVLLERSAEPGLAVTLTEHGIRVEARRLHHGTHDAAHIASDCHDTISALRPDLLHVVCGSPRSCLPLRETATDAAVPVVLTEQYVPGVPAFPAVTVSRIGRSYRTAAHVIFVSGGNRDEMSRLVPDPAPRAVVIPNAVPAKAIAARCPTPHQRRDRAAARRAAGTLRVACVARLAPQKGIEVLLRAGHRLGPAPGMVIDVFGTGPLHDQLLAERDELGIGDSARLAGWCDDVVTELAEHDLFVLPSRQEGMPFAVLESMAAGIPVIATDVPGTVEALGGGAFGTVVPRDDPAALASALARFRANPDRALDRARDASAHVTAHHDLDDCMARTLTCWHVTSR
ncbi:MAG: glycosyltransferase [Pseudonocardiaceae bacterium]